MAELRALKRNSWPDGVRQLSIFCLLVSVESQLYGADMAEEIVVGLLREGDKVELRAMKRNALNGCSGIVVQVLENAQYQARVRCRQQRAAKTVKVNRRQLRLLEVAQDDTHVHFVRPGGQVEIKYVNWCRNNGFTEVAPRVWAGDWWGPSLMDVLDSLSEEGLQTHEEQHGVGVLAKAVLEMEEEDGSWEEEQEEAFDPVSASQHMRRHGFQRKSEL
jgi:hypothetical protein